MNTPSREIKFRAWDTFNERMVYEPYIFNPCHYSQELRRDPKYNVPFVYYETWQDVDDGIDRPCFIMQYTGLKDKNKKEIYEGDIVIGYYGWVKGDGYKKKGFPDSVRFLFEVKWSDGKERQCGFWLMEIGPHSEDKYATEEYFYRNVNYSLREDRECELRDNEIVWKGYTESLEIIGNIFENPEILQS